MKKKYGNQSAVARRLGISRAAVSKLVNNRERTGAPLPEENGYDLDAFAEWYVKEFDPRSGPTRGIRVKK